MYEYHIEGGFPIKGTIAASGNKNAALPCIAAVLLTDKEVTLRNIPDIEDTGVMIKILERLGVTAEKLSDNTWKFCAKNLNSHEIPSDLAKKFALQFSLQVLF